MLKTTTTSSREGKKSLGARSGGRWKRIEWLEREMAEASERANDGKGKIVIPEGEEEKGGDA